MILWASAGGLEWATRVKLETWIRHKELRKIYGRAAPPADREYHLMKRAKTMLKLFKPMSQDF